MDLIELHLVFFSAVIVQTYGVTLSPLMQRFRIWLRLHVPPFYGRALYCPVCVGTWVAVATALGWMVGVGLAGQLTAHVALYFVGLVLKSITLLILLVAGQWWPEDSPFEVETAFINEVIAHRGGQHGG